ELKQAEAALRESQQFLEDAQSMGKLGGWSFDLVTQHLYMSKQIYDISEVPYNTELTVELAVSVYVDPAAIEAAMANTIATHEPYDVELEIITLKGNHRWVRSIGKPIVEDGEVVKLVGTHQDISDMKQAELGLQVANDNLARLNALSDRLNRVETIDEMLLAILEPLPADTIASVLYPVYDDKGSLAAFELAAIHVPSGPNTVQPGTRYPIGTFPSMDTWLDSPDSMLMVEDIANDTTLDPSVSNVHMQLGLTSLVFIALTQADEVISIVGFYWRDKHTFSDGERAYLSALSSLLAPVAANRQLLANLEQTVTTRTEELQSQLTETLRFKALFESSPDIVGYADLDRTLRYTNPAGLAFFGQAAVGSQNMDDIYDAESAQHFEQEVIPALTEQGLWQGEVTIVNNHDDSMPVSQIITVISDQQGEPIGFGSVIRDITASKALEQSLKDSNAVLGQLSELSQALNKVSNKQQLLEVVSQLAFAHGAATATLFDVDTQLSTGGNPAHITAVATLNRDGGPETETPVGTVFNLAEFQFASMWLNNPSAPMVVSNVNDDARLDDATRQIFMSLGLQAQLTVPLLQGDQWIGVASFTWSQPHTPSKTEMQLYEALVSLVPPALTSINIVSDLEALVAARSGELTASNTRLALLNNASTQLSGADSFDSMLQTLSELFSGDFVASVNYPLFHTDGRVRGTQLVNHYDSSLNISLDIPVGTEFLVKDFPGINVYVNDPAGITIFDDVASDPRVDENSHKLLTEAGVVTVVYLTLRQAEQIIAFVSLAWKTAYTFTTDETTYLNALPSLLAPVVANLKSLQGMAESNERLAVLNHVSTQLSAASSLEDLLEVVVEPLSGNFTASVSHPMFDDNGAVNALRLASQLDSTGRPSVDVPIGAEFSLDAFPSIQSYINEPSNVTMTADIDKDESMDARSKAFYKQLGLRANVYLALRQAEQITAFVNVAWFEPHPFSEDEQAYLYALPALLSPVVANLKSLEGLAQSNANLATINRIGSQLKAADSKDKMLEILLEPLDKDVAASLFYVQTTDDKGNATTIQLVSQHAPIEYLTMDIGTTVDLPSFPGAQLYSRNSENTFFIEDVALDTSLDAATQALLTQFGVSTFVSVPLRQAGQWVGFLTLSWFAQHTFSNAERIYLQALPTMLTPPLANRRMVESLEETVTKRSEELAKSRQLMRATIDNAPLIISVKDTASRYVLVNKNIHIVIPGFTADQVIGLSDYEVFPKDIADAITESDNQVMASQEAILYESVREIDGTPHTFLVNKFPMFDDNGNIFAIGIIGNDITKQREQEHKVQAYRDQLSQAEAELQVTQRIQELLLPADDELDAINGLDIASYMKPAEQVGGDYYDILQVGDSVKFGIGDVTGHGLESGLLMLMTQTAVRTLLSSNEHDPKRIMNILNQTVFDNLQRMQVDKSLTLSLLDYDQGTLRLSGQHEHVLIIRGDGTVEAIDTIDLGMPLGLEEDISHFIAEKMIHLAPAEGVVLFTDGITEAENNTREQFGLSRLIKFIEERWQQPAQAITDAIIQAVYDHVDGHTIYDDITLVVFKRPSGDFARSLMSTQDMSAQPHIK
ncbi:MAG: SpoIIE family protein phosphatase, partial [Deinococcota bacterium]